MVRLSDQEFAVVSERAQLAGLAVGAWIGEVAVGVARGDGRDSAVPDLLRLHADVVAASRLVGGARSARVVELMERLDRAVDAVIAAAGTDR